MARFDRASVRGLSQVRAAFKRVDPVMRTHLLEATDRTAMALAAKAKQKVRVRFGFLKQAIDWSISTRTGEARVGLVRGREFAIPGRQSGTKGSVAIPSKYGHLQEFGSPNAGPSPFMMPAAESEREPYLQRCRNAGKNAERELAANA